MESSVVSLDGGWKGLKALRAIQCPQRGEQGLGGCDELALHLVEPAAVARDGRRPLAVRPPELVSDDEAAAVFGKPDRHQRHPDLLHQPDLAEVLELVAADDGSEPLAMEL